MRLEMEDIRRLCTEAVKEYGDHEAAKAVRARKKRSKEKRDAWIGIDIQRLSKGIVEAVLPIIETSLSDGVLMEEFDKEEFIRNLREKIYKQVLQTIAQIEAAKSGKLEI